MKLRYADLLLVLYCLLFNIDQGLGVVCSKEGGFGEDDFVVEFLGEVMAWLRGYVGPPICWEYLFLYFTYWYNIIYAAAIL